MPPLWLIPDQPCLLASREPFWRTLDYAALQHPFNISYNIANVLVVGSCWLSGQSHAPLKATGGLSIADYLAPKLDASAFMGERLLRKGGRNEKRE